jgi:hypothetical protein
MIRSGQFKNKAGKGRVGLSFGGLTDKSIDKSAPATEADLPTEVQCRNRD